VATARRPITSLASASGTRRIKAGPRTDARSCGSRQSGGRTARSGWTPPTGCFGTRSAAAQEYRPGLGPGGPERRQAIPLVHEVDARATAVSPDRRRSQGGGQSGLRYSSMEGALARVAHRHPTALHSPRAAKNSAGLTYPPRRNMIASIRGSERWVAGFKSESWPASEQA
jgi:hypothetical protein